MKSLLTTALLLYMAIGSCTCAATTTPCPRNVDNDFGLSAVEMKDLLLPINLYIESGITGDSRHARQAFAVGATMSHVEGESIVTVPIDSLYAYYEESGPQTCSYQLTACNTVGNVAMIRIESVFGETKFTDMFTLLKQGSEWKITSKIFTVR